MKTVYSVEVTDYDYHCTHGTFDNEQQAVALKEEINEVINSCQSNYGHAHVVPRIVLSHDAKIYRFQAMIQLKGIEKITVERLFPTAISRDYENDMAFLIKNRNGQKQIYQVTAQGTTEEEALQNVQTVWNMYKANGFTLKDTSDEP